MRLVCPNCKANYEIPRQAVPIGGREVKCDSCGHSWFQTRTKKSTDEQLIEPENEITKEETEEVSEKIEVPCLVERWRKTFQDCFLTQHFLCASSPRITVFNFNLSS